MIGEETPLGDIIDINKSKVGEDNYYLFDSFENYGLRDCMGSIDGGKSLSAMNDYNNTWPEIADFIEANPEKVFTKPV